MNKASVWSVYRDAAFRRTIALILLPHTVFFGVQGLWVGRWLADVGGLSAHNVAYLLSSQAMYMGTPSSSHRSRKWLCAPCSSLSA